MNEIKRFLKLRLYGLLGKSPLYHEYLSGSGYIYHTDKNITIIPNLSFVVKKKYVKICMKLWINL